MIQKTPSRTRSGEALHYAIPELTRINWEDLGALARLHRYGGHLDWTIAQHLALCIELARLAGYSPRLVALCAAHDLQEAYLLDVPKGLKEILPGYQAIEARWEAHVLASLGLTLRPGDPERVKAIDLRALAVEMMALGWRDWDPAIGVANATGGFATHAEYQAFLKVQTTPPRELMAIIRRVTLDGSGNG